MGAMKWFIMDVMEEMGEDDFTDAVLAEAQRRLEARIDQAEGER